MKLDNNHLFKTFEIMGLIGLDVDIDFDKNFSEMSEGDMIKFGLKLFEALMKNSRKAQSQIEDLLGSITGEDTSEPMGLIKAISKIKNDREVLNFFIDAYKLFKQGQ